MSGEQSRAVIRTMHEVMAAEKVMLRTSPNAADDEARKVVHRYVRAVEDFQVALNVVRR